MERPFTLAFYLKSLQPLYGLPRSFAGGGERARARNTVFRVGTENTVARARARENITYVGYIALFRAK